RRPQRAKAAVPHRNGRRVREGDLQVTTMAIDIDRQQLLDVFVIESQEILARLEELVLGLELSPGDQELLYEIFRAAHTLKGNAACLQFDELTGFAHVVETLLERFRSGNARASESRVSQLLDAVDALRDLSVRSITGDCRLTLQQQDLLSE